MSLTIIRIQVVKKSQPIRVGDRASAGVNYSAMVRFWTSLLGFVILSVTCDAIHSTSNFSFFKLTKNFKFESPPTPQHDSVITFTSESLITPQPNLIICIYRISVTYGALAGWLYYTSVFAAILSQHNEWLPTGIVGTAMLYSTAAVVHALAQLCVSGLEAEMSSALLYPSRQS